MRPPKLYVILFSHNQRDETLLCLQSLKNITHPPFQLLLIDSGSKDGTTPAIRNVFPKVPILTLDQHVGRAEGFNRGISWALLKKAEWIFLLDANTRIAPDVLEHLKVASKGKKGTIFGGAIYRNTSEVEQMGQMWDPKTGRFTPLFDAGTIDAVSSSALFIHRSVVEAIGLLEPAFFSSWEDRDFCMRAKRRGFEIQVVMDAKVFRQSPPPLHFYNWWKGRLLWIERNLPFQDRKHLYRTVIFPELWRHLRKYLRFFFRKEKALPHKRALLAMVHYALNIKSSLFPLGLYGRLNQR